MVKGLFQVYLTEKRNSWIYSCCYCRAHLAFHEDLISKSFQGSQGRAYLFNNVVNVHCSEVKQRVLLTGIHFVADVFCTGCEAMLGWKYERAFEPSQRYKEGKVIIELAHLIKDNYWDREWLKLSSQQRFPSPLKCLTAGYANEIRRPLSLVANFSSIHKTHRALSKSTESLPSNDSLLSDISSGDLQVAGCSNTTSPINENGDSSHPRHPAQPCLNNVCHSTLPMLESNASGHLMDTHDTSPLLNNVVTRSAKPSPIMHILNASKHGWIRRKRSTRRGKSRSPSLDSLIPVATSDEDDNPLVVGEDQLNRAIVTRSTDRIE